MNPLLRHPAIGLLAGLVVMLAGFGGSAGLLVLMHSKVFERDNTNQDAAVVFDTPPPKRKPPPKKKTPPKKPKPKASKAPPPPSLGSALAGMSFGLPQFDGDLLGEASDSLLGDRSDAIMSDDAVDDPPRPIKRVGAAYPTRARSKNIEGYVVFSLLIQSDGSVSDIRILESEPPGMFDQVAMEAMRQWTYEPAMYQGAPVAVRARQPFEFRLD